MNGLSELFPYFSLTRWRPPVCNYNLYYYFTAFDIFTCSHLPVFTLCPDCLSLVGTGQFYPSFITVPVFEWAINIDILFNNKYKCAFYCCNNVFTVRVQIRFLLVSHGGEQIKKERVNNISQCCQYRKTGFSLKCCLLTYGMHVTIDFIQK